MRVKLGLLIGTVIALAVAWIGLYEGGKPSARPPLVDALPRPDRSGAGGMDGHRAVEEEVDAPASEGIERTAIETVENAVEPAALDASALDSAARGLASAVDFLRAALPERFGNLTLEEAVALVDLDLRGARVTEADLVHLAALPALESVSLYGTAITDSGLVHLYPLPHLRSIDLRGTAVTAAGVSFLPAYGLEALHLTDTQVTGRDLRSFPAMPNLNKLKLNRLEFGDEDVMDLALFPNVAHLELDGTKITDDGLGMLLAQNPALARVELRSTGVSPEGITRLHEAYPGVELVIDEGQAAMYGMPGWR